MTPQNSSDLQCPVGEQQCDILEELKQLRLEHTELSQLVHTDALTQLCNFRHFMVALEQEMERTRRTQQPTALVILDLDHFKKINDTWGHEIGNQALIQTAKLIRQGVRKLDIPCRYGGEEFAVILPNTDLLTGLQVAERLREIIQATSLAVNKGEIHLTASLGIDVFNTADTDTPEHFIQRADHQLYRAKQEGRNCVRYAIDQGAKPAGRVSDEEKDALLGIEQDQDKGKS